MIVTLTIKDTRNGEEKTVEVGDFRTVMANGFTIGNAGDCTVKVDCEPPLRVRVWGSGNQRLLEVQEGQMPFGDKIAKAGVGYPVQSTVAWDGKLQTKFQKEIRVDRYPFQLPPYELKLGEK